jgi:hypothetical protein
MEIHDSLNNQFELYDYIAKFNANLSQYLDNNNININYYCFFSKIIGEKHYIITSKTIKRKNNGYRLIVIQDIEKDNNIFKCAGNLNIIFENIRIKITPIIDNINDIANKFGIIISNVTGQLVCSGTIDYLVMYDKNILENDITEMINITDLRILNNFENLRVLIFHCTYNQAIYENFLPNTLLALTFSDYYNQTIGANVLPNSLQTLTFGVCYNKIIGINVLPNSLQTLTFGSRYNKIIGVNVLPNSLQTLTFGYHYNQAIGVNVLPNSLQTLTFGCSKYNQIIGVNVLPNSLKALTFGYYYNQAIGVNVLPNSLQTLTFGSEYNQVIGVNVLPNSLQTLTFGSKYNQIIGVNILPNSLLTLTFGYYYNQIIGLNILPNSLKIIYFNFKQSYEYCKKRIIPPDFRHIIKNINAERRIS